jgi:beta-glucosidase
MLDLKRADFGPNFVWGTATAAYQIEGAWDADGKSPSSWDHFTQKKPGKIHQRQNGNVACDHYHRWEADLDLMQAMGIPAYRFSLSWPRILPEGTGRVNQAGLDFYKRLLDGCLARGIQPWVTLYHWDHPQALEARGGWTNRDMVSWFGEYTQVVTQALGDRVGHWMILNEPLSYTLLGHFLGMHAPGRRGAMNFIKAVHHSNLVQAEAARIVKQNCPNSQVGTTFYTGQFDPYPRPGNLPHPRDVRAAARIDAAVNRMFIEPLVGLGYPTDTLPFLRRMEKIMQPDDDRRLQFDMDFIGLQYYTRNLVSWFPLVPYVWGRITEGKDNPFRTEPATDMGWEVFPEGIYNLLRRYAAYPGVRKLYVTESGCAYPDTLTPDGQVHDPARISYLQRHMAQVLRARQDGVPVDGYFIWSFMDNFEWSEGYRPRFGLVHTDYRTQQRTLKDSGHWFRDFLAGV